MRTLFRITKFGVQGFWRNLALSFNATFIMTLTLIMLSIFFVLNVVVSRSTEKLESRLDMTVFVAEPAKEAEVEDFISLIKNYPEIKEVKYINKNLLLAEWRALYKKEPEFRDLINEKDNPLLRELRIKAQYPEQLNKIAEKIETSQYKNIIDDISYRENQQKIITFINYSNLLRKLSLIISIFFAIIAIIVILTTVRLTIYSRREEIEIMRLVGATSLLIRAPFVLEGVLYGILATIFATLIGWAAILGIRPLEDQYLNSSGANLIFGASNQNFLALYQNHISTIIIVHLITAIVIGIASSFIAVRRHLK